MASNTLPVGFSLGCLPHCALRSWIVHTLQIPMVSLAEPEEHAARTLDTACREQGFFYRELHFIELPTPPWD